MQAPCQPCAQRQSPDAAVFFPEAPDAAAGGQQPAPGGYHPPESGNALQFAAALDAAPILDMRTLRTAAHL
jgi:hypothetical protein